MVWHWQWSVKNVTLLHNISAPLVDSLTSADLLNNNIIDTFYFCELCRAKMKSVQICFSFCVNNRFPHLLSSSYSSSAELMRLYSLQFVIDFEGLLINNDFQEEIMDFTSLEVHSLVQNYTLKAEMWWEDWKKYAVIQGFPQDLQTTYKKLSKEATFL